jgi:hypothetical protein
MYVLRCRQNFMYVLKWRQNFRYVLKCRQNFMYVLKSSVALTETHARSTAFFEDLQYRIS